MPDYYDEPMNAEDRPMTGPLVNWKEKSSDKDYYGEMWPADEAIECQLNDFMEVRRALRNFIDHLLDPPAEDVSIDINDFLKSVEASSGKMAKTIATTTTNAPWITPAASTTNTGYSITTGQPIMGGGNLDATYTISTQSEDKHEDHASGAVLTPIDMSRMENVELAKFKKRVLPYADVKYKGKTLKFTKDLAAKVAENFKKKPFEQVVFNMVDPDNKHNDDPMRVLGEVTDLSEEDDGLYAEIETNEKGTEYLTSQNPNIGCSVRFVPNFIREWDGAKFGPVIHHVAATVDPHITGLGPWQAVGELSSTPNEPGSSQGSSDAKSEDMGVWGASTVDLSREQFVVGGATLEKGDEDVSDKKSDQSNESTREGVQDNETEREEMSNGQAAGESLSQENKEAAGQAAEPEEPSAGEGQVGEDLGQEGGHVDMSNYAQADQVVQLSQKLEAAEAALKAVRGRERRQAIRYMLEKEYPGVAPFAIDAAEEILLSADGTEVEAFELSASGEAQIKEGTLGEPIKKLLDACKAKVSVGAERGTSRVHPDQDKDAAELARTKHMADYTAYLKMAGVAAEAPSSNGSE